LEVSHRSRLLLITCGQMLRYLHSNGTNGETSSADANFAINPIHSLNSKSRSDSSEWARTFSIVVASERTTILRCVSVSVICTDTVAAQLFSIARETSYVADLRARPHFRALHRHQLGHRRDRPDQANRDHNGNSHPCAHLLPLCVALSLAQIGLAYLWLPQREAAHRLAKFFETRGEEGKRNGNRSTSGKRDETKFFDARNSAETELSYDSLVWPFVGPGFNLIDLEPRLALAGAFLGRP
jgi:hypothetical protein